ncbi:MAG: hypothetical protein EAX96_06010 [Candidatus Lokiarchaeota archaeon]|nr:hypothetical protein [Candidatus Lokiarchaeota archaeon]
MSRRQSRAERRKQKDHTWFHYKKPTGIRDFFKVFNMQSWNAGAPVLDTNEVVDKVGDFINNFKKFQKMDLDYLRTVLPLRYCNILPRNYSAMLFALYINAFAKNDGVEFLDAFKNMEKINAEFENPESKKIEYDLYMLNKDVREKFLEIAEGRKKGAVFLLINSRMECPELSEPLDVILLLDTEMFLNRNATVYAFLNFKKNPEYIFPEALVFFNDKKDVEKEQYIEAFYQDYQQNRISYTKLLWKPDAKISDYRAHEIFNKLNRSSQKINYYKAKTMIWHKKPKIYDKSKGKKFEENLKRINIKKNLNDFTKNFKVYLPKDTIILQNYHAMFGLLKIPKFYHWTPAPALRITAYRIIKRRLFLYRMVGPFREVCGLPKRKKVNGKIEIYTKDLPEGIPLETIDILSQYASPSQVLHKIAKYAEKCAGDVEQILKFIRGLYRASRKISLMIDSHDYGTIPKVVSRYFI